MTKNRGYSILVCCGTAGATATILADKLQRKLPEHGIEIERLDQTRVSDVAGLDTDMYDLIVTAVDMSHDAVGIPVIRTIGLLTGVDEEGDLARIVKILKEREG